LGRIYTNQPEVDQLDKRIYSAALAWPKGSQHRPLAFGRQSKAPKAQLDKPISEEVIRDERWPLRVAAEFHSLQALDDTRAGPMVQLRRLKVAMKTASAALTEELTSSAASAADGSPLSITMTALRRLERQGMVDLPALSARYPRLVQLLPLDLLQRSPGEGLARLRAHAMELARAEVTTALQQLHDDSPNLDPGVLKQRRSQVLLQLKRVAPGRAAALAAVEDLNGDICTDGPSIAGALRNHWQDTFAARRLDRHTRQAWLRDDAACPNGLHAAAQPLLANPTAWRLRKSDVQRALALTSSSAPGPDGIPYAAWRRLGPLAASVLYEAAGELSQDQGLGSMLAAFPADELGNTSSSTRLSRSSSRRRPGMS
jgi:hypothetical protein